MKTIKERTGLLLAFVATGLIYQCKKDEEPAPPAQVAVARIEITSSPIVNLNERGAGSIVAFKIFPPMATNKAVQWASSNPGVATVSALGEVKPVRKGVALVTVTTEDGGKAASVIVNVSEPGVTYIAVASVKATPNPLALTLGGTEQLKAEVLPIGATNKKTLWRVLNETAKKVKIDVVDETTATVTGLAIGHATIEARTEDSGKISTVSVTVREASSQSAAPAALTVAPTLAAKSATSIEARWTAATDFGKKADGAASTLKEYEVRYSKTATDLSAAIAGADADRGSYIVAAGTTVKEITGLTSGTKYYVAVVARNVESDLSDSPPSPIAEATTSSGAAAPAALTAAMVLAKNTTSIEVSWTAATDFGKKADGSASTLKEYEVRYSKTAADLNSAITTAPNADKGSYIIVAGMVAKEITGLTPGTKYYVTVVARNSESDLSDSSPSLAAEITTASAATAPADLATPALAAKSATSIEARWSAATDFGKKADGSASTLKEYEVRYSKTAADLNSAITTAPNADKGSYIVASGTTSIEITGLTPNAEYYVAVVARNNESALSDSSPSHAAEATTPSAAAASGAPTNVIADAATAPTQNAIKIKWTAPADAGTADDGSNSAISKYTVRYQKKGDAAYEKFTTEPTTTTVEVNGLKSGSLYAFTVTATNAAGKTSAESAPSAEIRTDRKAVGVGYVNGVVGSIPDASLSASSEYTDPSQQLTAAKGRLGFPNNQCWAPLSNAKPSSAWWQADLGATKKVTAIAVQGRQNDGQWITKYTISYSTDNSTWTLYANGAEQNGPNAAGGAIATLDLAAHIEARYVRINVKDFTDFPSGRFEIYVEE